MIKKLNFLLLVGILASPNAEDTRVRRRTSVSCTAGYYSAVDAKEPCTACASGYWSLDAYFSCHVCRTCEPGFHVVQGCQSSVPRICAQCAAGTFSNVSDVGSCTDCVGDSWTKPGATECTPCVTCPPGTFQKETCSVTIPRTCQECAAGSYSNISDALSCPTCPDGMYSTNGAVDCTPCSGTCDIGHFIAVDCTSTTNKRCQECAAGFYADEVDSAQCTACASDWWSRAGESTCRNSTDCYAGHQISQDYTDTNDRQCEECPAGTYEAGENSASCSACVSGSTWSPVGATGCTDCLVCQPGHYQNITCTVDTAGVCAECAAGTYTSTTAQSSCTACSSTSWSVAGSTVCTDCENCAAGKFNSVECTATTARQCTNCAPGSYTSLADQSTCTDCGDGMYAAEGATVCETCTTCNAGHFINANCTNGTDTQCSECDAGYYAASTDEFFCTLCTESVNWSRARASACDTCTECQPGHHKSRNCSVVIDTECSECLAGTYATGTDEIQCLNCTDETFSLPGASVCTDCTICEPGFYAHVDCDPTHDRSCSECSAGNYTNSTNELQCTVCEDETWSFGGVDSCTSCVTCGPGFSVLIECDINQPRVCEECLYNTYTNTDNELNCTACDEGYWSLAGAHGCTMIE